MPKQNWLLVFDNYDDPKKFVNPTIKEFFPQTTVATDQSLLGQELEASQEWANIK
jgi:hypothetical protein